MKLIRLVSIVLGATLIVGAFGLLYGWTACRVVVPHNKCLVWIRKTGAPLRPGQTIADPGQKGIQRATAGPGQYFFNPWAWEYELHDLVEISAGDPATWLDEYAASSDDTAPPQLRGELPQIGVLVNKVGQEAPEAMEVVDPGFKGIQFAVLTPGIYRLNPYEFEIRRVPATVVPLGYCGVVTSQLGDMPEDELIQEVSIGPDGEPVKSTRRVQKLAVEGQRGVLRTVLPPGIYYLNPYVYKVRPIQIGYNQISQLKTDEASLNITFPSRDGFTIDVEVTVVWGRHPQNVAEMINRFGDVEKIKHIIRGQMRSICRNIGSEYESTDFIRGEKREIYQRAVTETLQRVLRARDIEVLIALIHNIGVHGSADAAKEGADLKTTIQRGYIAAEQDLTKQTQRETAAKRAELETAKVAVEIAREQITADTRKQVAQIQAEGQKRAAEIDAQRDLEVAAIEKDIAQLDAERTLLLGSAKAQVERLTNQADADGRRMLIEAFGSGRAYNLYTFARDFEPESIRLIFAGEGTFWTDLRSMTEAAAAKLLEPPARPTPPPK